MDNHFLLNMQRLLIYIRADIQNEQNKDIIDSLLQCIQKNEDNDVLVSTLGEENVSKMQLIQGKGELDREIQSIKEFIVDALRRAEMALQEGEQWLAHDLVDMLHVLPEVILINDKSRLREYWKIYVKSFSNRWKSDLAKTYKTCFRG